MRNIDEIYSLTSGQYIDDLCSVDNLFIRQLASLATEGAKDLQFVTFSTNPQVGRNNGSVINISNLTPLAGIPDSSNLLEEVAQYRAAKLNFPDVSQTFWKDNKDILMVDYLLSACLCYVEVFDSTVHVDKFFATRNRFIAGRISGVTEQETAKYVNYLGAYSVNYQSKQLKVLKMNVNKSGFKIVQPRSYLDFNRNIKVTPVFLMTSFVDGLQDRLATSILKFKYIKDNMVEREFVTTTSPAILLSYYEDAFAQKMLSGVQSKLTRGYVKLPELGISKYDLTGVRSLNISRITSVEVVDSFDSRYIDVNFDIILPSFKESIISIQDPKVLSMIYEDLTGQVPPANTAIELRGMLISFVDSQYAIGTTTALRQIHDYMVNRKQFFSIYNDGKPVEYGSIKSNFNLGVID